MTNEEIIYIYEEALEIIASEYYRINNGSPIMSQAAKYAKAALDVVAYKRKTQ